LPVATTASIASAEYTTAITRTRSTGNWVHSTHEHHSAQPMCRLGIAAYWLLIAPTAEFS